MVQFILDSGRKKEKEKVGEHKSGKMDLSIKDIGKMIWLMERED